MDTPDIVSTVNLQVSPGVVSYTRYQTVCLNSTKPYCRKKQVSKKILALLPLAIDSTAGLYH